MNKVPRRPKTAKSRHVDSRQRREQQGETQKLIDAGIIALVTQVIQEAVSVNPERPTLIIRNGPPWWVSRPSPSSPYVVGLTSGRGGVDGPGRLPFAPVGCWVASPRFVRNEIDYGHRLVAVGTAAARAYPPTEALTVRAALLAQVPRPTRRALVHRCRPGWPRRTVWEGGGARWSGVATTPGGLAAGVRAEAAPAHRAGRCSRRPGRSPEPSLRHRYGTGGCQLPVCRRPPEAWRRRLWACRASPPCRGSVMAVPLARRLLRRLALASPASAGSDTTRCPSR